MKLFKLIKGELTKILMRPLLYILTFVLVLAIFAAYFMFRPTERVDVNITSYDNCKTTQEVYNQFLSITNPFGKIKADDLLNESENYANRLSEINEDQILNTFNSKLNNLKDSYNVYLNCATVEHPEDVAPPEEINAFNSLYENIVDLKNTFNSAITVKLSSLFLETSNKLQIEKLLYNADNYAKNKVTKTSHSSHSSFRQYLENLNFVDQAKNLFDKIKVKSYEENTINIITEKTALAAQYMQEINTEIEEQSIAEDTKMDEFLNLVKRYYLVSANIQGLCWNIALYTPFLKFSDKQINTYFEFADTQVYSYQVNEQITKQTFLVDNNKVSTDYSNTFSPNTSSAAKTNAFDLIFFGLEITSFVIIIFTVVLVAGTLAGEQSNGTLKLLLIRPFSRNKVLTGKLLSSLIFAFIFLIFSTIIFFLMGLFLFGVDFTPILAIFNAQSAFVISPFVLLLIYLLCLMLKVTLFVLISLAISAIFRSNVAAVGISMVLYIVLSLLGTLLAGSFIYGFFPFSNFELFKFFGGSFLSDTSSSVIGMFFSASVFHGVSFWYALLMDLGLVGIITACTYWIFGKREVK